MLFRKWAIKEEGEQIVVSKYCSTSNSLIFYRMNDIYILAISDDSELKQSSVIMM